MKRFLIASALFSGCAATGAGQMGPYGELFQLIEAESAARPAADVKLRCAANGLLAGVDQYSLYLDKAGYAQFRDDLAGAFTGVGVVIEPASSPEDAGYFVVAQPIEGGPAKAAGVLAGDIIVSIDGKDALGLSIDDALSRIKGPNGSTVTLGFKRQGATELVLLSITREKITIPAVTAQLRDEVGIVRIESFSERAAAELKQAIESFPASIESLVIDLRKNPGGLFVQATASADLFLEDGVIASSVGRNKAEAETAEGGDILAGKPIAILVDRETASSAEILAGALQDRGRAFLVGEPTFGKGSIQRVFALKDGGAARLTTGHYEFASGARVADGGLKVDLETAVAPPLGETESPAWEMDASEDPCDFAAAAWARRYAARQPQAKCPSADDCQLEAALAELTRRRSIN